MNSTEILELAQKLTDEVFERIASDGDAVKGNIFKTIHVELMLWEGRSRPVDTQSEPAFPSESVPKEAPGEDLIPCVRPSPYPPAPTLLSQGDYNLPAARAVSPEAVEWMRERESRKWSAYQRANLAEKVLNDIAAETEASFKSNACNPVYRNPLAAKTDAQAEVEMQARADAQAVAELGAVYQRQEADLVNWRRQHSGVLNPITSDRDMWGAPVRIGYDAGCEVPHPDDAPQPIAELLAQPLPEHGPLSEAVHRSKALDVALVNDLHAWILGQCTTS